MTSTAATARVLAEDSDGSPSTNSSLAWCRLDMRGKYGSPYKMGMALLSCDEFYSIYCRIDCHSLCDLIWELLQGLFIF